MKDIAVRAYQEPAVAIGLLTSVAMLVIKLASGDVWDTTTISAVVAPLLASLGIRELVSPAIHPSDHDPPAEPSVEAQQIKEFDE